MLLTACPQPGPGGDPGGPDDAPGTGGGTATSTGLCSGTALDPGDMLDTGSCEIMFGDWQVERQYCAYSASPSPCNERVDRSFCLDNPGCVWTEANGTQLRHPQAGGRCVGEQIGCLELMSLGACRKTPVCDTFDGTKYDGDTEEVCGRRSSRVWHWREADDGCLEITRLMEKGNIHPQYARGFCLGWWGCSWVSLDGGKEQAFGGESPGEVGVCEMASGEYEVTTTAASGNGSGCPAPPGPRKVTIQDFVKDVLGDLDPVDNVAEPCGGGCTCRRIFNSGEQCNPVVFDECQSALGIRSTFRRTGQRYTFQEQVGLRSSGVTRHEDMNDSNSCRYTITLTPTFEL